MMKTITKIASGISAFAVVATAIPASVFAWGDSNGGRPSYTIDQINNGALGNSVVMNSIKDNPNLGDEKNFVGAREDTGNNAGTSNVWSDNVKVEDGKTYIIRLYTHNNSTLGYDAIATGVKNSFSVPNTASKSIEVNGFIDTSNASPVSYWDNVTFSASSEFYLSYIAGSALIESNGKVGGSQLGDSIVTSSGVLIGYDALDGKIPGCFQYASYVTIKVKATFVSDDFTVAKTVRLDGTKEWKESVDAKVGDIVNYQIHYKNIGNVSTTDVMVKDSLPKNLQLVTGTTKIYNASNPNGLDRDDTLTTTGVNIGGYAPNGDGYLRFSAVVVDETLVCGVNKLVNWGQVGVGDKTKQDSADVLVEEECEVVEYCEVPGKEHLPKNDPDCKVDEIEYCETPGKTHLKKDDPDCYNLPVTGVGSVASGIMGVASLTTAGSYYIASRRSKSKKA